MATAKEFIAKAASQIGVKESPANSNNVKYGIWYGMNYQPWCDMFVSWCGYEVGAQDQVGKFAYCPYHVDWFKKQGRWKSRDANPQPGWVIFFANSSGVACHVGIVEAINGSTIVTIEGNTSTSSNDNGGAVMRRNRTLGTVGSSWYVLGYGVPNWDATSSTTTTKPASDISKVAQEVINGKWGNGNDRIKKLVEAGYDYNAVQKEVNLILKGETISTPSDSKPSLPYFEPGTYTITATSLNVRTGPGLNYTKKSYSQLTANGRANATLDGALVKGTRVTVSATQIDGGYIWGLIPSGWICLYENGNQYVS